jgi:hypothetical protein
MAAYFSLQGGLPTLLPLHYPKIIKIMNNGKMKNLSRNIV